MVGGFCLTCRFLGSECVSSVVDLDLGRDFLRLGLSYDLVFVCWLTLDCGSARGLI